MQDQKQIAGAILIVGVLIAGAILLKDSKNPNIQKGNGIPVATLAPINKEDRILGNPSAKVTVVMYEDFQCPFCGVISGLEPLSAGTQSLVQSLQQRDATWTPFVSRIINDYVKNGSVQFVYRDFAFLGPESQKSAEAARCAGDQGKFWEYHDYLFTHQNGENEGNFSDLNLKSFAKELGLNTSNFDKCLDDSKYAQAVADSKNEGASAGVTGTPKGFILRNGKIVSTIDGAESYTTVKPKIDAALK
ncbi:MAG: thioredoxin domain-containing protein [Candidatus Paceibacterota bacterium]